MVEVGHPGPRGGQYMADDDDDDDDEDDDDYDDNDTSQAHLLYHREGVRLLSDRAQPLGFKVRVRARLNKTKQCTQRRRPDILSPDHLGSRGSVMSSYTRFPYRRVWVLT